MKQISIYFENKNENDTITLAEMAEQVENQGESLKVAQFGDFANFRSYFNMHYRPLLERISDGESISDNDRHTLNFLASDLLEAFGETDEDTDTLESIDEISDTQESETEETAPDFFTPGTRYRCIKAVKDAFTAGRIYEQRDEPTAHYAWFTNDKGNRHAWPQPREIAHELEIWDDLTADDIDPRNFFEAVGE